MSNYKRTNPYEMVLKEATQLAFEVEHPIHKPMFFFPTEKLNSGWTLGDVYQRTLAASQLGFDVVIAAHDGGLEIKYRKKPTISWRFK